MSGLRNEIEAVRRELAQASQSLERKLQTIDEEASRRRHLALSEADALKAELSLKMARLMIAETMLGGNTHPDIVARQAAAVSGQERPSATQTILEVLSAAMGSVPSDALAKAVIDVGWTKSAAEKARTRLYAAGFIARDESGHYTITGKGVERLKDE